MTKNVYKTPSMVVEHAAPSHMLTTSGITSISGAEGFDLGGSTDDAGITTCNVKNNDWTDIWDLKNVLLPFISVFIPIFVPYLNHK